MNAQIYPIDEGVWFYCKYERFGDALEILLNDNGEEAIIEPLKRGVKEKLTGK